MRVGSAERLPGDGRRLNRLKGSGIDLDRDGLMDQGDRDDNPALIFVAGDQTIQAGERARFDSDQFSGRQIGTGLGVLAAFQTTADRFNFGVVDGRWPAVEGQHSEHAWSAEDAAPLAKIDVGEDISGKDGVIDHDLAVFPAAGRGEQGKKGFDGLRLKLLRYHFFMARLGGQCVPASNGVG